ncbi:MAG: class I SAM-dependent methyltransferase [Nostoc sp.]|uniref:class I SAM-dependent methyltransferase n=1 Tax=Nostoc sp. TaxID=1180 RepID=UPI002FF8E40C
MQYEIQSYPIFGDPKEIFHHHYTNNLWRNEESVSGPGSTIEYTQNIQKEIPQLVSDLGIKVILDAPCGDFNWFRMIAWKDAITYIGADIVEPLINRNQQIFGSQNNNFTYLDIAHDPLPKADMWLCRDCLFHLSNHDILLAIENFFRSNIRYLLTSTHSNCENEDIPTGSFRLLNLQKEPFNFGKPIALIEDWIEGYPIRHLALWEREVLMNTLVQAGKNNSPA